MAMPQFESNSARSWLQPMPIAWLTVESAETGSVLESASSFYNWASDGGLTTPSAEATTTTTTLTTTTTTPTADSSESLACSAPCAGQAKGHLQRSQRHAPSLALGLCTDCLVARSIRERGEAVIHTATWQHRHRIQRALTGDPVEVVLPEDLRPAQGVSVQRLAAAPVAFSCKLLQELSVGDDRVAFIFSVVGIHVDGALVVDGYIDSQALQAIAACEPTGSLMIAAREEHVMPFPAEKDAAGCWIVAGSEPMIPRTGAHLREDLVYEPPRLPCLPHNPLKALVVPRPIGWISTRGEFGDNLSPYSFFGYLAPDVVFFGAGGVHVDGGEKDAVRDARSSGVFCVNMVPWKLRVAMNASAAEAPHGVDEFSLPTAAGHDSDDIMLEKASCEHIDAPRVGNSPMHLECKVLEIIALTEDQDVVVVGRIVHAAGSADGAIAARGGYFNYFRMSEEHVFSSTNNS
ncbi:unnamed protein product [Polarella glacialis]|uniref:Flavin reductase like domain-containing protein n=1 Tax=Polarella glacialis TaxID=89957 RepID=A0A813J9F1_POLGL|nr:unnamed protein product [Polarella glacialis]